MFGLKRKLMKIYSLDFFIIYTHNSSTTPQLRLVHLNVKFVLLPISTLWAVICL